MCGTQSDDASESDFIASDASGGGAGGGGDDEYEQGFSGEAKLMRKFIKRVDREPTQCARYEFGGKPLWMSDAKPTAADVPPCPHCAAERYARERASMMTTCCGSGLNKLAVPVYSLVL